MLDRIYMLTGWLPENDNAELARTAANTARLTWNKVRLRPREFWIIYI